MFSPFFYYTLVYTKSSSLLPVILLATVGVLIIPTAESPAMDFVGLDGVAVKVDPS